MVYKINLFYVKLVFVEVKTVHSKLILMTYTYMNILFNLKALTLVIFR